MLIPRRDLEDALGSALSRAPAVALLGPRQVGKTTLARALARSVEGATYLDLERARDRRRLEDADAFLRGRGPGLVVIDEVHRAPDLFAELRGIIDERREAGARTGQFLLLGSASLELVQAASESLAGRIGYVEMGPINPSEARAAGLADDLLWSRGGFPDSLTAPDDEASLAWREAFVRSYLERDVPLFAPRAPAALVGRLWRMLANGQGTALNLARLAQALGASAPTVARYVDLLRDLMLVRRLEPWSGNLGKRLVRAPKLYVRDSGLVHALLEIGTLDQLLGHPVAGGSWEGFVVEALIAAAGPRAIPLYYRTADGAEIDLVLEVAGRPLVAVEVKRSSAPRPERGFAVACDDLGVRHRIVVGSNEEDWDLPGARALSLASAVGVVRGLVRPAGTGEAPVGIR